MFVKTGHSKECTAFWKLFLGVFLIVFFGNSISARATHIVGGEIFYECLGGDNYLITLNLYRDCLLGEAEFDNPATITVYNNTGQIVTTLYPNFTGSELLEVEINNPCLQAPPNVCVDYAIYEEVVSLPTIPGGYNIVYQRCCRNNSILNLSAPENAGATFHLRMSEFALSECNSSPYFNEFPPVALCTGDPLQQDLSATDPDGDQLVYSLCTPLHGASDFDPAPDPDAAPPFQNVNWASGFSANNPVTASPGLAIDPVTGLLTGTPTVAGQYVVGVCVEEYHNGVLLDVARLDFQFNVVECTSNVEAIIAGIIGGANPCNGLEVEFENESINGEYFYWDFGVDGITTDISEEEFPTYTYPDSGTYIVSLIANPGYPCANTTDYEVTVHNPVLAEIAPNEAQCADVNSFDFSVSGEFGGGAEFLWDFGPDAVPSSSTNQFPTGISFSDIGEYEVSVTVTDAICDGSDTETVRTLERPKSNIAQSSFEGCNPFRVNFEDSSSAATPLRYLWNFGTGVTSIHPDPLYTYDSVGVYDIRLTVWTTEGCVDTSTLFIPGGVVVNPTPVARFDRFPVSASIFDPVFSFEGHSDSIVSCWLYPGDGTELVGFLPNCNYEYTYSDTGDYQAMFFVENQFGCIDSTYRNLRVEPEYRFWIANAFSPNGDGVNDKFGPIQMGIKEYDFKIYDRWGQVVFATDNPEVLWDGVVGESNPLPPTTVFAYKILLLDVYGEYHNYYGHVTLYRN